jgi:hypothetical protein
MYSDTYDTNSLDGGVVADTRCISSHALSADLRSGLLRVCLDSCNPPPRHVARHASGATK